MKALRVILIALVIVAACAVVAQDSKENVVLGSEKLGSFTQYLLYPQREIHRLSWVDSGCGGFLNSGGPEFSFELETDQELLIIDAESAQDLSMVIVLPPSSETRWMCSVDRPMTQLLEWSANPHVQIGMPPSGTYYVFLVMTTDQVSRQSVDLYIQTFPQP